MNAQNTPAIFQEYYALFNNCPRGAIRNPRTNRCVMLRTNLGKCIQATAWALVNQAKPPVACPASAEYDFHTRACVTDKPRVMAIRHLKRLYAYLQDRRAPAANVRHNNAANQLVLNAYNELMQTQLRLDACSRDLKFAREKVAMMEMAMKRNMLT